MLLLPVSDARPRLLHVRSSAGSEHAPASLHHRTHERVGWLEIYTIQKKWRRNAYHLNRCPLKHLWNIWILRTPHQNLVLLLVKGYYEIIRWIGKPMILHSYISIFIFQLDGRFLRVQERAEDDESDGTVLYAGTGQRCDVRLLCVLWFWVEVESNNTMFQY